MSNCTLKPTCFLIFLSLYVGLGHGRWKPSRESLKRDMEEYKKMSKRIKQEFEAYYDEYSDDYVDDPFDEPDNSKYFKSNIYFERRKNTNFDFIKDNLSNGSSFNETQLDKSNDTKFTEKISRKAFIKNENILWFDKKWPKFEDILLAIGKKYDWKNDRWIKVKHKDKAFSKAIYNNSVHHQKHNFVYRIVKLNRAKSKRNIVIAVTAVR